MANRGNNDANNTISNSGEQMEHTSDNIKKNTHTEVMPKLTRKQKAFADYLIANPKASATEAVKHAYDIKNHNNSTARSVANEIRTKPSVQRYLELHADNAKNTVLEVMEYSKTLGKTGTKEGASYASVALAAAKDVIDRVDGKATQRIEQTSQSVNITIDLS